LLAWELRLSFSLAKMRETRLFSLLLNHLCK
jgi:hypothetical protein